MFGDIVLSFVIGLYEDYNLNCLSELPFERWISTSILQAAIANYFPFFSFFGNTCCCTHWNVSKINSKCNSTYVSHCLIIIEDNKLLLCSLIIFMIEDTNQYLKSCFYSFWPHFLRGDPTPWVFHLLHLQIDDFQKKTAIIIISMDNLRLASKEIPPSLSLSYSLTLSLSLSLCRD